MPRSSVHVRPAGPADLPAMLVLADELREVATTRRSNLRPSGVAPGSLRERYAELLTDPGRQAVLAVDQAGEVLGMAIFAIGHASALLDLPAVQMSHVIVADRHRRRGAGRALVAAATAYAEEVGVEHVVVGVAPAARESNRFYARLGFAPLVVRRVATVVALRRALALPEGVPDARPHASRRRYLRSTLPLARDRVRSDRRAGSLI